MNVTILPSGDRAGAVAESAKSVSCTYSDGEVTGAPGRLTYHIAAPAAITATASAAQATERWRERAATAAVPEANRAASACDPLATATFKSLVRPARFRSARRSAADW